MASRYLVRFDDLCPTMNWQVWNQVEAILKANGVKPLIAVVPDNQDPHLSVAAPAADFWDRVRAWQAAGWAIGLHGYQHTYVTKSAGIIGRNRYSEFAGLDRKTQREKLQRALDIFRNHGVHADAWVAPAHSFDETTVELLAELGVDCISDGYAFSPYICRTGQLWIPQQLGKFWDIPFGTWTVCLHVNDWQPAAVERFGNDVQRFRTRISSLQQLRSGAVARPQSLQDIFIGACFRTLRGMKG